MPPRPMLITTTNTLSASANAVTGDVTLFVNIDACPPAGAPNASGTVQFFEGSTAVGSFTLTNFLPPPPTTNRCGGGPYMYERAQLTLLAVSPGTHTYTAVYSGDTVYAPSTSAAIPVIVPPRPVLITTTNTLSASANAVTGDVTLFVNIDACPPAGAPNASGTVQFFEGSTAVGSFTLTNFLPPPPTTNRCGGGPYMYERAQLTLLAVSPGTHTYTAVYSGDTVYAPSTSAAIPVIVPPRPVLITTTNTLSASANAVTGDVTLFVNIDACPPAGAPNASGTVQFFEGSTAVGSFTLTNFLPPPPTTNPCGGGPYMYERAQLTLLAVSPGTHTYTAVYSGDTIYAPSTSAAIPVTVPPRPVLITTTNTLSASANAVTGDVALFVNIDACPPAGAPNASGTVQFFEGSTAVGSFTLSHLLPLPIYTNPCGGAPYMYERAQLTL